MQNKPLNVMQVVRNLEIGGGQEVVRTLAENLSENGCRPVVCTFKDGPLRQDIEGLGIPVEVLPGRGHSVVAFPLFIADLVRIRRDLAQVAKTYRVDVVQTHLLRVLDFVILTLRSKRDLLVFWTFQNAYFTLREDHLTRHKWLLGPKRFAYRVLYRLAARWVDGFIAVSEDVKTALQEAFGIPPDKITVICNSVDVRRYQQPVDRARVRRELGLAESARVMIVVATFKEQKGHRYLVEAAPPVIAEYPDLHILFVGDGELREELQLQVREAGVEGHIHFLGFRQDIPELLAASDCFVLPSLWEGLPMALVEAMATGLPIIATEVSGSKQAMINGETGLLVGPGDVAQLEEAMVRLLSQPDQARAMGSAAQRRVESNFGASKQAEEHIALYHRQRNS
jgi:glycosyltransferase involved in cell wall biosynthesis